MELKLQLNYTLRDIRDIKIVNDLRLKTNVLMNLGELSNKTTKWEQKSTISV